MNLEFLMATLTSTPGRYAKALFETAKEKDEIKEILANFDNLSSFLKNNFEIERVLLSSVLSKKNLDEVWQIVGQKMSLRSSFLGLIRVLVAERRLALFYSIYEKYQSLVDFHYQDRKVGVYSAHPLGASEETLLKKTLSSLFPEKIHMTFAIDESLLSGIVVKTDTLDLDASYKTQLKHLADVLKG